MFLFNLHLFFFNLNFKINYSSYNLNYEFVEKLSFLFVIVF